ncbi:uncharacterized protein Dvar_02720 [Desulfosarcina variabilis str. Montpellier]
MTVENTLLLNQKIILHFLKKNEKSYIWCECLTWPDVLQIADLMIEAGCFLLPLHMNARHRIGSLVLVSG